MNYIKIFVSGWFRSCVEVSDISKEEEENKELLATNVRGPRIRICAICGVGKGSQRGTLCNRCVERRRSRRKVILYIEKEKMKIIEKHGRGRRM